MGFLLGLIALIAGGGLIAVSIVRLRSAKRSMAGLAGNSGNSSLSAKNREVVLPDIKEVRSFKPLLEDPDVRVRIKAIEKLQSLGGGGAAELVFSAMADRNEDVCMTAAEALKELKEPACVPPLVKALAESGKWVPARVAEVLISFGEQAVPDLLKALEVYDHETKGYLIEILGEIGTVQACSALHHTLRDSSEQIQLKSAEALGKIGSSASLPFLLEALNSASVKVRIQLVKAIAKLGKTQSLEDLAEQLTETESPVNFAVLEALRQNGPEGHRLIQKIATTKGHPAAEIARQFVGGDSGVLLNIYYK